MKRPLLAVAFFEVCGILLAPLPVPLTVVFGAGFVVATLFVLFARARPILLAVLLAVAGWANLASRTAILSPNDLRLVAGTNEFSGTIQGTLLETPRRALHQESGTGKTYWTSTAQIAVTQIHPDGQEPQCAFGKIAVTTAGYLPDAIFAGQTVEVGGVVRPARWPEAEGLFDYRAYLDHEGIYYEMRVHQTDEWHSPAPPGTPPLPDRFQAWGRKALALGLPAEDEALQLEWALTLGWKAALTDQVSEPFVQASTYHIFAVDGLRIAIVSGILIALLRTVGVPRLWCGIAAAPFLVFYAAMTGWPASAVRALVMAFIVFGGWALKRPSDLVNSLLAAVVVILTWEPRQLFQAGFQLSFLVVLCIILITPFFERLRERLLRPNPLLPEQLRPRWQRLVEAPARWTLGLFLASIAAWLGSIPLVAYYFHVFTPVSGPANLLAIPLCALVLICNLSSLLLAPWLPSVAVLFNYSGWFLMTGIVKLSQWFAHWPAAFAYVAMPSPPTMALYYLLLLGLLTGWLLKSGPGRRWKIGVVLVLSATWGVNWCWSLPDTRLTVLPLGGGHGVYLRSPDSGNDVLLDCGDEALADSVTKPFLRAQGVNRLSRFVVTHGEKDFSDGAGLIAGEFRPTTIATSAVQFRSAEYRRFAAALRTNGLNQTTLRPGERLETLTVLAPGTTTTGGRTYDDALVFRADITGVRVLLLSDLGHVGQENLLNDVFVAGQTNALRADVVVTSPSGQDEPLGDSLLEAIQPQLVIIADSESVPQRRAGRELRERLATRNVPVIYTGDSGGVTLIIRASRWSARAMDGTRYSGSAN